MLLIKHSCFRFLQISYFYLHNFILFFYSIFEFMYNTYASDFVHVQEYRPNKIHCIFFLFYYASERILYFLSSHFSNAIQYSVTLFSIRLSYFHRVIPTKLTQDRANSTLYSLKLQVFIFIE